MRRGVGYCTTTDCSAYLSKVFLLEHSPIYWCLRCAKSGQIVEETSHHRGDGATFAEVEVKFNYDFEEGTYPTTARVTLDDLPRGSYSTYVLSSPLIQTEKRALKVAEAILAHLLRFPQAGRKGDPSTVMSREILLDFDRPLEEVLTMIRQLDRSLTEHPFFGG